MDKILIVEDSVTFGLLVKNKIESELETSVVWVKTLRDTIKILGLENINISAALLDFNLPDAPNGEVIDEVVKHGIPSIIFTGNVDEDVRDLVWSKKVADYILKDDENCLDYVVTVIKRLTQNQESKILVVDDSSFFRKIISDLLYVHQF